MKAMIMTGVLVAAIATSAMPAASQAADFSVPVDDSFAENVITYNDGRKGYRYRMKLTNANGYVALCGIGHFGYMLSAPHERRAFRGASLLINGKTAIKDFSFFTQVPSRAAINGAKANCRVSEMRIPTGEVSVDFDLPRISFRD